MSNYVGARCPVCNKKFAQADDIVVCPVCGAPHHRECYLVKNECAFAEDHLSGNAWRPPKEQSVSSEDAVRACSVCGTRVHEDALFCQVCGTNLNSAEEVPPGSVRPGPVKQDPQSSSYGWDFPGMDFMRDPLYTVYGGVNPEEEIDGIPVAELVKYIGSSSAYYLPRFRDMSQTEKTISPNFPALFFNFFYYFYRKMYLIGSLLLGIYVVSAIPSFLYTWETLPVMLHQTGFVPVFESVGWTIPSVDTVDMAAAEHYLNLSSLTQLIHFIIGAVVSLCANRLYYERCVREVKRLRDDREAACETGGDKASEDRKYELVLTQTGGTSKMAVVAVLLSVVALYFIVSGILINIVIGG